jgi:excisionase family DNA binding protein
MPTDNLETVPAGPALVSVTEAARLIGCSRGFVYELRARRLIGFSSLGGQTKIARAEISRLISDLEAQARADRGAA